TFFERELKRGWIRFVFCRANDAFALHTACYWLLPCVNDRQRARPKRNAIRANSQKPISSLFVYRTACAAAGRSCRAIQQGDAPRANSLRLGRVSLRASSRTLRASSRKRQRSSTFESGTESGAKPRAGTGPPGLVVAPPMAKKGGSG